MRRGSIDFKQDSDVIHLNVGGMPVIVLHSFEVKLPKGEDDEQEDAEDEEDDDVWQ